MVFDPIQQIAADVAETKERVGRVEADVGETKVRVGRVEVDVGETKERVGRVEANLMRVEGVVYETKDRIGRLEVHAEKAAVDIAQVQQLLLGQEKRFDAADERFESFQADLNTTLQSMQASLIGVVNTMLENFTRAAYEARISRLEQAVFGNRT